MKRTSLLLAIVFFVCSACKEAKTASPDFSVESAEKIMSIDEIREVEKLIDDSTFMDAKGDTAWHRINSQMVRVKIGGNYYLRKESQEGSVTSMTYSYGE